MRSSVAGSSAATGAAATAEGGAWTVDESAGLSGRDCSCAAQQLSAARWSAHREWSARLQHARRACGEPVHPTQVSGAAIVPVNSTARQAAIALTTI